MTPEQVQLIVDAIRSLQSTTAVGVVMLFIMLAGVIFVVVIKK